MKKITAFLICFVMFSIMLAGCGQVEVEAEKPAKKWIISTDKSFKPFEYMDENNEITGIDIDILAAIAKDQGFEYELKPMDFDSAVAAVQAGQADGIIAGATIKQERIESGWIFSDGYYDATQTFVVRSDSDIRSFDDLIGKKVAVKRSTTGADFAASLRDQYAFSITIFDDSPSMYAAVENGEADACIEDTPIMIFYIKENDSALKIPEGMESEGAPYGMAIMDKKNRELLDRFNIGLADIKANGQYQQILDKYLK